MPIFEEVHDCNSAFLYGLPFNQLQGIPIYLEAKQLHEPNQGGYLGKVVILDVEVVETVLIEYPIPQLLNPIIAEVQHLQAGQSPHLPQIAAVGYLVIPQDEGAKPPYLEDGVWDLLQFIIGKVQIVQGREERASVLYKPSYFVVLGLQYLEVRQN